jgi:hypothetical protein
MDWQLQKKHISLLIAIMKEKEKGKIINRRQKEDFRGFLV